MTIVLTYTTEDGKQQQAEFKDDIIEIDLSNRRITSIDLSPLATCTSLQTLRLDWNRLQSIDLSPLYSCTRLKMLLLFDNQLQSIDLSPLSSCTSLKILWLAGNKLQSIDLSPLATCTSLQRLVLHYNQLQSIDLSPLSSCTSLQDLNLYYTKLQSIDLSPLSFCTSLQGLVLDENQLQSIDLSPLSFCTSLQDLGLGGNQLQSIDLSPLASCSSLNELRLGRNQLQSIDLSPLSFCTSLQRLVLDQNQLYSCINLPHLQEVNMEEGSYDLIVYQRPAELGSLSLLEKVIEKYGTDIRIQQDILAAMGLSNYGFIDNNLLDLFLSITEDAPLDRAREKIRERLLEEIVLAIDQRRATTGLRLEELTGQHREIATRAQRVIELRESEVKNAVVGIRDAKVDLRALWLTAYGFEILSALEMRLTTDLEGLEKIRKALGESGFELKTGETSKSGVKMNDELKQAIWWIVENRSRPWSEIQAKIGPQKMILN